MHLQDLLDSPDTHCASDMYSNGEDSHLLRLEAAHGLCS